MVLYLSDERISNIKIVCDIETNGLDNPDKIWCVVAQEIDSGNTYIFENVHLNPEPLETFSANVTQWIGHNFIAFDSPILRRICPNITLSPDTILDTLVVSRLLNHRISGGHSMENWAKKLGETKVGEEIKDWSKYSSLMLSRCKNDVMVNKKLYDFFLPFINHAAYKDALRLELEMATLCTDLHSNGFPFAETEAKALQKLWQIKLSKLDTEIKRDFPPQPVVVKEITPKLTAKGTLHRQDFRWYDGDDFTIFTEGAPFTLIRWEEFNPGSPSQIVRRLNKAGWKPIDKTKGHQEFLKDRLPNKDEGKRRRYEEIGWTISEANLKTLPVDAPVATKSLVERLILANNVVYLEKWLDLISYGTGPFPDIPKIHGHFLHIGSWTQRMSHQLPNMANVSSNPLMRQLWIAPKGHVLIGTDADGIQMRIFAHYVNEEKLTQAILNGNKEDKTDIHSLHQQLLGNVCRSRDVAKTFIYAFLLGAGKARISSILSCSFTQASEAITRFLLSYPGLLQLRQNRIPNDVSKGYFVGLDGRRVKCDSAHLMLGGYLQNGEATIMKMAALRWNKELKARHIPYTFVNFVHDEWQTIVPDDPTTIETISVAQIKSIIWAGEQLNLNIALDAQAKVGYNWNTTH